MRVLGIDTTAGVTGVAVLAGDRTAALVEDGSSTEHSRRLLAMVLEAASAAGLGLDRIDGIAVACGPGSFTGLRIGLATANALAWSLDRPVVGVPTLEAMAWGAGGAGAGGAVVPLVDARRQQVFAGRFAAGPDLPVRLEADRLQDAAEAVSELVHPGDRVRGEGALRYRREIALWAPGAEVDPWQGSAAEGVARIGAARLAVSAPEGPAKPVYLRRPHVQPAGH